MGTFETRPRYFYIAIDEQGKNDIYEYGELYREHLLQIPVQYQEIEHVEDLVYNLNQKLSLLIDVDEDEIIDICQLPQALEIAKRAFVKETHADKQLSIAKFISAIETAISYDSPLLIWW